MAGVRKKPSSSGRYQGFFIDETGKKKYFTGSMKRSETLRMARKMEDDCRQVRLGYREPRQAHAKYRDRSYPETVTEYLAWGRCQGGRKGRPWAESHAERKANDLRLWGETLELKTLGDMDGLLPRVEAVLQEMADRGRAGKSIKNNVEAIVSFCNWGVIRGYLRENPLAKLGRIDITPRSRYRALTIDETWRLLEVVPDYLRYTYILAMLSGLRANELRSLTRAHLDIRNSGLRLEPCWTKNREPGFQPLPQKFVKELVEFAESGIVPQLYQQFARTLVVPRDPLVFVNTHPARELDGFLRAAGIPKETPEGKVAFHALRTSFVTLTYEAGATHKEAQELARHKTPGLTANVYGRTRSERLAGIAEKVGEAVLSGGLGAHMVHPAERDVTSQIVKYQPQQALRATGTDWRRGDSNPRPEMFQAKRLHA